MTIQYTPKKAKGPQEPEGGQQPGALAGIKQLRPKDFRRLPRRQRSVSRPYGGVLSHKTVRDKIVRAFLIEEVKLMKKIMSKKKEKKTEEPKQKKKETKKKDDKKTGAKKPEGKKTGGKKQRNKL